jgi:hypothetical protein
MFPLPVKEDKILPKSKKEKVAGLERHKQLQRAKQMKRKQKKQVPIPQNMQKSKK